MTETALRQIESADEDELLRSIDRWLERDVKPVVKSYDHEDRYPAEIVEQMKALETIDTLPSRRIFRAIFALDDSGSRVGFDELHARLEESDQHLLAQAVLGDDGELSHEEVAAAIASMRRTEDQLRRVQLKTRISEFERAGRLEEAMRLTMELQGLERSGWGHGSRRGSH